MLNDEIKFFKKKETKKQTTRVNMLKLQPRSCDLDNFIESKLK